MSAVPEQERQMKTTDPDTMNGYGYSRENGDEIFVHDKAASNDGGSRDEEIAGTYDVYVNEELKGEISAPEPLPSPGTLHDLAEQFLGAESPAE